jgi:glucosyl-dolichyl phosphate glucuronosyltransferase
MKISIIIPTYNRGNLIGITIKSFLEQNYPKDNYEILVVNNNSTDNSQDIIKEFIDNSYGVKVHYLFEKRQGVHYARNTAAKAANFELLYFTDDDMIADCELLNEIIKPFLLDSRVAVATGKVLPKWEETPPQWILKHCNNYLLSLLSPDYDFLISDSIGFLYSCHQAIKRDVFYQVEGFNPEYTHGKYLGDGETGLNLKVKKQGCKFGFNGKSLIYHIIPGSRLSQKYLNKRFLNNGRAHAYTSFKENPSVFYLVMRIGKNLLLRCPRDILTSLLYPLVRLDKSLYRIFIGKIYYWIGNISFSLNIYRKSNFRKFVLKNDWLTNDTEFDNIAL